MDPAIHRILVRHHEMCYQIQAGTHEKIPPKRTYDLGTIIISIRIFAET